MTIEIKLPEWDFSPFWSGIDDEKIRTTIAQGSRIAQDLQKKYRGNISKGTYSAGEIKELLETIEDLIQKVFPISMYSRLLTAKDSQNNEYRAFAAEIQEKVSIIQNDLVFVDLELNSLDDNKFANYASDEVLDNYRHYLLNLRKYKEYQLKEEEEQMIILKDQYGKTGFQKLYGDLTSSFSFEVDFIPGKEKQIMNGPQLRALRMHPEPEVRRKAMKLFFDKYEENKLVLTSIFNNLFKDYYIENSKRGYPTPITRRNMGNEIKDETVEVLEEATTASYPNLVHRYYNLKKKIIGLDKLTLADIYAPLPKVNKEYTWEETEQLVLKAFDSFDPEFAEIVQKMIDEKRIDAPPSPGKSGGAFCAGSTPNDYPWVFMNFNGNIRDVSTLAHELGHAIHHVLGMVQTQLNFGISLVTAEIASVFSEIILSDYLLNNTEMTKEEKIAFISQDLENNFATSHRQNMFHRFESLSHELIKENVISSDQYCEMYQSELRKMFGDSVEIPEEYKWEWASIPHFISVYHYVYAYNMSNLLVLGLYGLYLERGNDFIPQFKKLLSVRKAMTPEEMLAEIGVDINEVEFWDRGLKYLEGMIDQLEELLE